jgi:hypothetical protein
MMRSRRRHLFGGFVLAAAGLIGASLGLAGCTQELPEPDSEGARLYVQYCSGEGCHGAIPPQTGGPGYWRNQYTRMLDIMRDRGWPIPDEPQEEKILDYLQRHAG